jgi:hypothetical protein
MTGMRSRFRPLLRPPVVIPLVLALFVSALMCFVGFFYPFSLWGESPINFPTYFVSVSMMSVMPIFLLLVFISRRILAVVMWLLVIVNYYGSYVLLAVGSSIYYGGHSVARIAFDSFFTFPAVLSIMMAVLVEFAYRMGRRGMLELNETPKGGAISE